jgi:hypothetical protein
VELDANMSATEITITKARNKTREDWMIAEQNLKRAKPQTRQNLKTET